MPGSVGVYSAYPRVTFLLCRARDISKWLQQFVAASFFERSPKQPFGQGQLCLRFLDARIVRSSVEKPDKDETAGDKRGSMGIVRCGLSQSKDL